MFLNMFHAALLCENPECDASCVFKPYILDENALWCIYYMMMTK